MSTDCRARRARDGITLIEVVIVLAVIGLLISFLLPAVQRVRESAGTAGCRNDIRQIGIALQSYHARYGRFPPAAGSARRTGSVTAFSWLTLTLDDMGETALLSNARSALVIDPLPFHNPPHTGYATVARAYVCKVDDRLFVPLVDTNGVSAAYTSYVGVSGRRGGDGVFGGRIGRRIEDISDGSSNTLLVGERPPPASLQAGRWYTNVWDVGAILPVGPNTVLATAGSLSAGEQLCIDGSFRFGPGSVENPCDRYHFWSLHLGGANWALADGSARFLTNSAWRVVNDMATRSGGEAVE